MSKLNAYSTHRQYTIKELSLIGGNSRVLELGIGLGSSPLMHEYCLKYPNSVVESFETDEGWFEKIRNEFGGLKNYSFNLLKSWNDLKDYVNDNVYDLAFVDQAPWMARIESIDLLKSRCNVFILHDYDFFNKPENPWVAEPCKNIYITDKTSWLGKKYLKDFNMECNFKMLPPTLVLRKVDAIKAKGV